MEQKKHLSYPIVKKIISDCQDKRTKALLAFQYGFGCRAGELAKFYIHKYRIKTFISTGPKIKDIEYRKEMHELNFKKPNFKQEKEKDKSNEIIDVKHFVSFVNESFEQWLFSIILNWIENRNSEDFIFNLRVSRIRSLIDYELKKYELRAASHWLRHSRAYHIAEITNDPYAVQAVLGHADPKTSMIYVNQMKRSIYKAMEGGKTFQDYLGVGLNGG